MFALRAAALVVLASCAARAPAPPVAPVGPPAAARPVERPRDGDDALRRILAAEARRPVMRVAMQQRVDNRTFGKVTHADATVWVDRARGVRWDYAQERSFVATATELWMLSHDGRTYHVKPSPLTVPVAAWFAPLHADLQRDHAATLAPSRTGIVVELAAREPGMATQQITIVAGDDGLVRSITYVNQNGDETRHDIGARSILEALPPGTLEVDRAALEGRGYRPVEAPR